MKKDVTKERNGTKNWYGEFSIPALFIVHKWQKIMCLLLYQNFDIEELFWIVLIDCLLVIFYFRKCCLFITFLILLTI